VRLAVGAPPAPALPLRMPRGLELKPTPGEESGPGVGRQPHSGAPFHTQFRRRNQRRNTTGVSASKSIVKPKEGNDVHAANCRGAAK